MKQGNPTSLHLSTAKRAMKNTPYKPQMYMRVNMCLSASRLGLSQSALRTVRVLFMQCDLI